MLSSLKMSRPAVLGTDVDMKSFYFKTSVIGIEASHTEAHGVFTVFDVFSLIEI